MNREYVPLWTEVLQLARQWVLQVQELVPITCEKPSGIVKAIKLAIMAAVMDSAIL